LGNVVIFAQNIEYRAIAKSAYAETSAELYGEYSYWGEFQIGETVLPRIASYSSARRAKYPGMYLIFGNGISACFTNAKNFVPVDTHDVFEPDIVIDYQDDFFSDLWCPAYYCEVLVSKERNTRMKFESSLFVNKFFPEYDEEKSWFDFEDYGIDDGRFVFYSSAMHFNRKCNFLIEDINKISGGYAVKCISHYIGGVLPVDDNFAWDLIDDKKEITLLLLLDGDYMEIYVENKSNHFGTIVRVKEEFIRQYESLVETNNCDLTNVIWPRRTDGSMDYPLPQITAVTSEASEQVITLPDANSEENTGSETEIKAAEPQTAFPFSILFAAAGGAVILAVIVVVLIRHGGLL
jgi:hypothetical protein